MTVTDASAVKYTSYDILAMYLHAEWGDLLASDVRHFPGACAGLPELDSPAHFYRRVADLVAVWADEQEQAPLTVCDVGAGTGRTVYELARRMTSVTGFTVVEPSPVFCDWTRRLLIDPPQDLDMPTPGRVGDPDRVSVTADRLPRVSTPLRLVTSDVEAFARTSEQFDVVTCFNVLDRVRDPAEFTAMLSSLVAPGGLLVISCPFDFEPQYSSPEVWVSDLRDVIPTDEFKVVATSDLPYSFKQFNRRFNWYLTQVVAARRH
jgi:SAM-dependent methyltransferase